jgi:hypothetical protein
MRSIGVLKNGGLKAAYAIRATVSGRTSSPRVSSGPRACRSSCSFSPRRGVRNDRAFHRARGARMCWMRAARMPSLAHGQWPNSTPKIVELNRASEADLRLRSAREWILRLAASLTGNCRLRRPRPDRANCRAGMHLDRPPVASASISCPTADPRLSSVIRSIQARHRSGHRIPLPRHDDDRDAPLTGAGWLIIFLSVRQSQHRRTKVRQLFFLKTRKRKGARSPNYFVVIPGRRHRGRENAIDSGEPGIQR